MYGLTPVAGPAAEPVSTADLKAWLRVEHDADDAKIAAAGATGRELVERALGRQLATATWLLTLDGFPWPGGWAFLDAPTVFPDPHTIRLPKAPLQSVTSVQYYDLTDTLRTLSAAAYVVDAATDPGRIVLAMGQVWPVTRLRPGAVRVTFSAGYGAAVPEVVKTAIKMTAAWLYEHAGDDAETAGTPLPAAVDRLLALAWNGELEYGA